MLDLKIAAATGIISATGITFAQIAPEDFSGWGIHLVLGAVAVAAIYFMFKTSEGSRSQAVAYAESLMKLSSSVDHAADAQRELANELRRSPCLLQKMQHEKMDLPPDVSDVFRRERSHNGGHHEH
jgi:hypothetical protein